MGHHHAQDCDSGQKTAGAGKGKDSHRQLHPIGQGHDKHVLPLAPADNPAGKQGVAASHHSKEAHHNIAECQHEQDFKTV